MQAEINTAGVTDNSDGGFRSGALLSALRWRVTAEEASPAGMADLVSSCPDPDETPSPPIFPILIPSLDAGLPRRALRRLRDNERRVGGMPKQLSLSYFHFSSCQGRGG